MNNATITVTGVNWTTVRAVFNPYQVIDGTWRLRGNIVGYVTGTVTSNTITIAGVTFKNIVNYNQTVTISPWNTTNVGHRGRVQPNTGNLVCTIASTLDPGFSYSFDCELESKPTWAD